MKKLIAIAALFAATSAQAQINSYQIVDYCHKAGMLWGIIKKCNLIGEKDCPALPYGRVEHDRYEQLYAIYDDPKEVYGAIKSECLERMTICKVRRFDDFRCTNLIGDK